MWRYVIKLFIFTLIPSKLLGSVMHSCSETYNYVNLAPFGIDAATRNFFIFSVETCSNAHIGLFTDIPDMSTTAMYEIVLGGWFNSKSVIRKVKQGIGKASLSGSFLDCYNFVPFWISWKDGTIRVGQGHVIGDKLLMEWTDPSPYVLNYVAISSWKGVGAVWIIENDIYCVNDIASTNSSGLLVNVSGYDINDTLTYDCDQTVTEGNLIRWCLENGTWSGKEPKCDCNCECFKEVTNEQFSEMIKDMKIEATNTSKQRRKRVCAPDNRPSSKSIGGIGVSILAVVFCLVIIPDIPVLYNHFKNMLLRNVKWQ